MFPYFEVLGKTIGSYGLCAVVGLVVCGIVASLLARRYKIIYEDIVLLMVVIGVSLLIGGHILFGITNLDKLIALFSRASSYSIKEIFGYLVTCFGGMVFYGGFLGACAGLLIYTKHSKDVERGAAFDLFAVCIPLFHVFGRIGCFFSGCCYGMESKFGFVVHGNTVVPEINDVRRLPVPLIEATCNLVIFLVLLRMFLTEKKKGKLIMYYMLIYPVVRFIIEFFRGDAIRGFFLGLSTSQWISLILFGVAVWNLFVSGRKKKTICAGILLGLLLVAGARPTVAYAEEGTKQETELQNQDAMVVGESKETAENGGEAEEQAQQEVEIREMTGQEKFVFIVCCIFAVALCIVIAMFGNPNDRLKDKYKRARRQQRIREKRQREKEKLAAKRAEREAKYAADMAQYEADLKAYEEEKAAREAAKAAKKAEKEAKKKQ